MRRYYVFPLLDTFTLYAIFSEFFNGFSLAWYLTLKIYFNIKCFTCCVSATSNVSPCHISCILIPHLCVPMPYPMCSNSPLPVSLILSYILQEMPFFYMSRHGIYLYSTPWLDMIIPGHWGEPWNNIYFELMLYR